MPAIPISDGVSVVADAQLAPWSALSKYAQGVPALIAGAVPLANWRSLTLADPAVKSLDVGLSVERPVELKAPAPAVTLCADATVHFAVVRDALFSPDVYGDNIQIPQGDCAVRIGLSASIGAGASLSAGKATFGLNASAGIEVACYRFFPAGSTAPTVFDALSRSVGELVIPFQVEDLDAMPAGAVVTLGGSGSLKFSASANLLAMTNPLATLELPQPAPQLAVTQGAKVSVGASWEVECEYQLRVQKVDAGRVRLGWYRKHATEFRVTAQASAGITAGTAAMNLFPKVIQAISADAAADEEELKEAGLSDAEAGRIEAAVSRAVGRTLEVAVTAEFGSLKSDEAAFLYEVDLNALDGGARAVVAKALHGDLTGLAAPCHGVKEVCSILTRAAESRFSFRVNLLGIFNYARVTRLALKGKVTWTPSTGELVIVDEASASEIEVSAVNFGADERKLRKVMANSFLLTAVYRGSQTALAPPQFKSTQSFFRLDDSTNRGEMQRYAMALSAVDLAPPALPADVADFGRTAVHLEADYDGAATVALFLDGVGRPRAIEEYERAGRNALLLLVPEGADDSVRRKPALDDVLWKKMQSVGNVASFGALFPGVAAPLVGAIGSDYLVIEWWADAMQKAAALVAQILEPGAADSEDLRKQLAKHMRGVVRNAREQFGDPWGLVATYLVAPGRASAGGAITGPRYVFSAPPRRELLQANPGGRTLAARTEP